MTQRGLSIFRWVVAAALAYSLIVMFLTAWPSLRLINRPFGGFLWQWDNTNGVYRVDETIFDANSPLKPADFILAVNDLAGPMPTLSTRAQELYDAAAFVCDPNNNTPAPQATYLINRRGQETLQINAPIQCFHFFTWLRFTILPIIVALIVWIAGIIVFWADSRREFNLLFVFFLTWSTHIIAKQYVHEIGIHTSFGQFVAIWITVPAFILPIPLLIHLAAIWPEHRPLHLLHRTAIIWYIIIPVFLIIIRAIQFQLGAEWHEQVGRLSYIRAALTAIGWSIAVSAWFIRAVLVYRTTETPQDRRMRQQAKGIMVSLLPVLFLGILMVALENPSLFPWIPIGQLWMFLPICLSLMGMVYTVLRYQLFPGRLRLLSALTAIAVAICIIILIMLIPQPSVESSFILFLLAVIGTSILWTQPSPMQRFLQRLAAPGTIDRRMIEQFNQDVRVELDPDVLPQQIVNSLETRLELNLVAIWLGDERDGWQLDTFSDSTIGYQLPPHIEPADLSHNEPTRLLPTALLRAGCEIGLPLVSGGERIGLIGLGQRWTGELFDHTDMAALQIIANQASLAMSTARYIRRLRQLPLELQEAQQLERRRIAGELHDSTKSQLNHLVYKLEKAREHLYHDPVQVECWLNESTQELNQAIREMRLLIQNLLPLFLPGMALSTALSHYLEQVRPLHKDVVFGIQVDETSEKGLDAAAQETILRVCQLAIANALLHGQPRTVQIIIQPDTEAKSIRFTISDDGKGFVMRPLTEWLAHGHYGLYLMELQVQQHPGGHLTIESVLDHGTVICGRLPARQSGVV
ncbi:MAG: histidine kinase [Candidatus Promineifilaceae bacterium]